MVRFDAYSATSTAIPPLLPLDWFFADLGGKTVHRGKGFHTFADRIWVEDEWGGQVGAVQYGGRQGERVMVEVKGEGTPKVVERLRDAYEHRCTRVDACVDFEAPGTFERLLEAVMEVKHRHDLYGERRGDWDKPELGRTQYLGSPKSTIRARLYEKGKQPEYVHLQRPDLVRLELQVRPAKEAKSEYARLSALDVWGASRWTRDLAGQVLGEALPAHPPGSVWRQSSLDRRLGFLAQQYGPTLLELHEEVGTWECVGLTIAEVLRDLASKRSRQH